MFLSKSTIPRNFTTNLDLANLGPTNLVEENFRRENLAIENLAENLLGPTLASGIFGIRTHSGPNRDNSCGRIT